MTFESISRRLEDMHLKQVKLDETIYYFINGKVVATKQDNLIVMYFKCNRRIIWNNHNMVAVAFAKDFLLSKDYLNVVTDVFAVTGFSGTVNTLKFEANGILVPATNNSLSFGKENNNSIFHIGTIGFVLEFGIFQFYDHKTHFSIPPTIFKEKIVGSKVINCFPLRDATFIIR